MREHGAEAATEARATCDLAERGWRDECVFLLAEADGRGREQAARWCREAGRYTVSCLMHLWQDEAEALAALEDPAEAAAAFDASLAWAGEHLDDTLRGRAWGLYYRTVRDPEAALDTGDCEALHEDHRRWCVQGTREALGRGLNVWEREHGHEALLEACELDDAGSRAEVVGRVTGMRYAPGGGLDALVKAHLGRHCRTGPD